MATSVNTNQGAMIALQNLAATSDRLNETEARISSGLKVATAKDNGAVYGIAQHQRADLSALGAVTDGLNRATSIADVALAAGQSVSDLLNSMKQKVIAAADFSIDTYTRQALNQDFQAILQQIARQVASAKFNGANMLDGSQPSSIRFVATADASQYITLTTQNLSLGGSILSVASTDSILTVTTALAVLSKLNTSIDKVNLSLAALGSQATGIGQHARFVSKLSDAVTTGIGNLVDADLPSESARLQSLQAKQQLGTQALSIANQQPQSLLTLFR